MLEHYPDRTYKNCARKGTIKLKIKKKNYQSPEQLKQKSKKKKVGKSFIKALLSTRWTINGAMIVIIKQAETAKKSYALAKE